MENLKQKTLALFFTRGISLKDWQETGNFAREIAPYKELAKFFEEIYFFTYGDKGDLEYQNLLPENIKIFPKKWNLSSTLFKKADILKTNQMSGSWLAVLAKWLYRKKLVVRCGYEWLKFLEKQNKPLWKKIVVELIEKIAYQAADKIILSSNQDKKFVVERFKILPSKIEIIPNYIDTELFKPSPTIRINQPNQHKSALHRLIFVGRLEEQKNLFNLIKAVAELPIELVIIGTGSLKEKLKKFSKEKKANVEFKENIINEKLPEELNKSEIFILPSFYEGCPKTLLEAMSCGLPCIGANVEGIKEIIQHKENGYLCEPNPESIRKAILKVLKDKALQEGISQNARKTILEKFSLEKILEKEVKTYKTL